MPNPTGNTMNEDAAQHIVNMVLEKIADSRALPVQPEELLPEEDWTELVHEIADYIPCNVDIAEEHEYQRPT